jgi:arylsulfatase A-like enzyme
MLKLLAAAPLVGTAPFLRAAEQEAQPSPSSPRKRPNFLFIYSDDQRYDAMSCVQAEQGDNGRFPFMRTPNMDRLAREGLRFRNAMCVNSLCSPSRACYLTGRYNHYNGVVNNHMPYPLNDVNHGEILRDAGYTTAYFGKWHMDSQKERPGFDHYASYIGHGKYMDWPFEVNGQMQPTSGWIDDVATDFVIDFLRKQKDSDKPFDAVLGFKSPHVPRTPPDRAKQRFAQERFRHVPSLDVRTPYSPGTDAYDGVTSGPATEHDLDYFRCISAADDCLGRILDALDELKLADNTIVFHSSDHGYYLGEHGLKDKRAAYEEGLRIPMLVRYPKLIKPGSVCDDVALNIDLAPTLLDLAGVKVPASMQGKSWRPLLTGEGRGKFRDTFFYEYFYEHPYSAPTITAVRTPDAKLIKYPGHENWNELYDLTSDPYEVRNLIDDPAHADLKAKLLALHDQQSTAVGYCVPVNVDPPGEFPRPYSF